MATQHHASRLRRALSYSCAVAAFLFINSCAPETTGVGSPGFGSLRVAPKWSSAASRAPVTLNRVQAIVERITVDTASESSTHDTLVNNSRAFNPSDDELRLSLRVPLQGSSELLTLTLLYFADQALLFSGSEEIEISAGNSASVSEPEMFYIGPGSNAVGLIIEPFDTAVTAGSLTPFRATAINGQENDVGAFYMRWSLSSSANGGSIDAAGRLRAPTQPGTLWVRGNLPNGVDDSVQVTVTGTPGGITIMSGNHQTGQPGSPLELPLVVRVTTGSGAPVPDASVTWVATIGGGGFDVTTTTTDANGESQNIAILGENAGINAFTATVTGAGTVTFLANENLTGATITWLGNTSDVWSTGANWVGGIVPGVLDSVVIPSAEFYPVLDTTPVIGALTLRGNSRITLNSHGLGIVRALAVTGNSYLEMTGSNDAISVGGDVLFDGASSVGHLTAGGISVAGNFTQGSTTSGESYAPSGSHIMVLAGPTTTVTFATPGLGSNQSHFNDVAWAGQGTLTLASNIFARVMTASFQGVGTTITSTAGRELRATQFITPGQTRLTFNNVSLNLTDTTIAASVLSMITFQNMPTNRAQLTVNYTGGVLTLNELVFSTTPVAPNGVYLDATDSQVGDGSSLEVRVQNPTPASMGTFFREGGDAEIIWPYSPPP